MLACAAKIVRAHHERWDGCGYPDGLRGDAIPLLSRVIATCDAFVAIGSDRPYRRGLGAEAALEYVCRQSGSQFDARTVDALVAALSGDGEPSPTIVASTDVADRHRVSRRASRNGRGDLTGAIAEFDVIPAFAPAYERLIAATATDRTKGGELVTTIESDTGLTVAVLRQAQNIAGRSRIANVGDAVSALGPTGIEEAIKGLPRAEFP